MRKFTVFTVILAITVIVTVAEMFVNNYLPTLQGEQEELSLSLPESLDLSKIAKTDVFEADGAELDSENLTNRLGEDVTAPEVDIEDAVIASDPENEENTSPTAGQLANLYSYDSAIPSEQIATEVLPQSEEPDSENSKSPSGDFEDQNYTAKGVNVNLRQEQIESAGFFNAYIEEETSDGKLYKTVNVDDLYDAKMQKFLVRSEDELMARVYIFSVGPGTKIEELYQLLKSRCGEVPLVSVNATNDFGSESFYMNDSSRANTVFLTVRIGQLVYGFSYPKNYHQQVKNLIQLITWEVD